MRRKRQIAIQNDVMVKTYGRELDVQEKEEVKSYHDFNSMVRAARKNYRKNKNVQHPNLDITLEQIAKDKHTYHFANPQQRVKKHKSFPAIVEAPGVDN
jgi:hypothetical protein